MKMRLISMEMVMDVLEDLENVINMRKGLDLN